MWFNHIWHLYQNEILWFILIAINFTMILFAFKFWGKTGLFIFAAISIVLANIQALKQITLFGLNGSMGDISYIGVYLISDILSENYGKATARKLVGLGIFFILIITIIMYISLNLIPSAYDQAQGALDTIFGFFPRLVLASLCAFAISQSYDIAAYQFWRNLYPAYKYIWLRNGLSTIVSQLLDNAIFTIVAFSGIFKFNYMLQIFITSCVLRTIISILDTPFVYWSVKLKPKVQEL
jgi:queuosine precursor transporter